ncbi:hypothetical protein AB0K16_21895 [Nonomuraea jabiensis]|uniref:hypothetical protein n=1 Tax=Nonomuraea jabiensis TaxID=882448 RepID=UPI003415A01C
MKAFLSKYCVFLVDVVCVAVFLYMTVEQVIKGDTFGAVLTGIVTAAWTRLAWSTYKKANRPEEAE